jgi:hypothetical protein
LDSATGGTFMSITLGAATKLLDNMMVNYSEWHTERAPQGKKVNYVEETSSLSDRLILLCLCLLMIELMLILIMFLWPLFGCLRRAC